MDKYISRCKNKHYFFGTICPYCGEEKNDKIELRENDCIKCGGLCNQNSYCCYSPAPIK